MARDYNQELATATSAIVDVIHPKKIIVAGAGAGKTTTFGKLLDKLPAASKHRRLVITFLGGLKRDLEKDLGEKAQVQTFHGYCYTLLRQNPSIRSAAGFTTSIRYVPRIGQIVKSDWVIINGGPAPMFVPSLRTLANGDEDDFFVQRGKYYDAVGYDDSTAHLYRTFASNSSLIPTHDLVIVDEVQDLNKAEMSILDHLSTESDIVLAGDDDQALYGNLRDASEEHIRSFYNRPEYLQRNLPFCMRCPSVVVDATNDIIGEAHKRNLLGSRIDKKFEPFPRAVDKQYPSIKVVKASVQTPKANLFGKYILEKISSIPAAEIQESHEKGFPTVLIIGAKPYSEQVKTFLEEHGVVVETKARSDEQMDDPFTKEDGLRILRDDIDANLGWRILLETEKPEGWRDQITKAITERVALKDLINDDFRQAVAAEVALLEDEEARESQEEEKAADRPSVRMTSFEGAKGMSAQHVFILGLEEGRLPLRRDAIRSIEVRRMIVALTRTRKQCYLLVRRSSFVNGQQRWLKNSVFIDWIKPTRLEEVSINAASFR